MIHPEMKASNRVNPMSMVEFITCHGGGEKGLLLWNKKIVPMAITLSQSSQNHLAGARDRWTTERSAVTSLDVVTSTTFILLR